MMIARKSCFDVTEICVSQCSARCATSAEVKDASLLPHEAANARKRLDALPFATAVHFIRVNQVSKGWHGGVCVSELKRAHSLH